MGRARHAEQKFYHNLRWKKGFFLICLRMTYQESFGKKIWLCLSSIAQSLSTES